MLICAKPIGYKWIFKRKLKPDGSLDKFKVRLVDKGYTKKKDFDYFDTLDWLHMNQPEDCVASGNEHKICKLVKLVHGLKKVPK